MKLALLTEIVIGRNKNDTMTKDILINTLIDSGFKPHDDNNTLFKYVSFETAKKILEGSSFRFSSPLKFNDPFEMNLNFLDFKCSKEEYRAILNRELFNNPKPDINPIILNEYINKTPIEDLIEKYKSDFYVFKRTILVLCLSLNYDSTLMWSHYADSHNGICIGIKIPTIIEKEDIFITMNVRYEDKIKPLNFLTTNIEERIIAIYNWIFKKSNVWRYENEVRCVSLNISQEYSSLKDLYCDIPILPDFFCEICYGVSVSNTQISEIENIISNKGYKFEKRGKMEISPDTFDLKMTELSGINL